MSAWWQTLTALEHVLLYVAIPATLLLLIQTVLLLIGGSVDGGGDLDAGDGVEVDLDGDGIPDLVLPDPDGCGDPLSHGEGGVPDNEPDSASPGQGLHLLTLRGVVAFLTLFGWGGLWLCQLGLPQWLAVFLAVPIGLAGMVGVAVILQQALRLQYDGTLDPHNAVGLCGCVYLTVPGRRAGVGKVNVTVQEQLREFEALTDGGPISTGRPVRVVGLLEGGALLVEEVEA